MEIPHVGRPCMYKAQYEDPLIKSPIQLCQHGPIRIYSQNYFSKLIIQIHLLIKLGNQAKIGN